MKIDYSSIPYAEVLHPTEAEFKDFRRYVNGLSQNPKYANASLVKIIPPKSFRSESLWHPEMLDKIQVVSPIEQQVFARGDLYELRLMSKKSLGLRAYKQQADASEKAARMPPNASNEDFERYVHSPVLDPPFRFFPSLRCRCKEQPLPQKVQLYLEHQYHAFYADRYSQRTETCRSQYALLIHRRIPNNVCLAYRRPRYGLDQYSSYREAKVLVLHRKKRF